MTDFDPTKPCKTVEGARVEVLERRLFDSVRGELLIVIHGNRNYSAEFIMAHWPNGQLVFGSDDLKKSLSLVNVPERQYSKTWFDSRGNFFESPLCLFKEPFDAVPVIYRAGHKVYENDEFSHFEPLEGKA